MILPTNMDDLDIKPKNTLMFTITFVPFAAANVPTSIK